MRTELTLIHGGFYLGQPKGFPRSWPVRFVLTSDHWSKTVSSLLSRSILKLRPSDFLQNLQNALTSPLVPKCPGVEGGREARKFEESRSGESTGTCVSAFQFSSLPRWPSRSASFDLRKTWCPKAEKTLHILPYPDALPWGTPFHLLPMTLTVREDFVHTPGLGSAQILSNLIGLR